MPFKPGHNLSKGRPKGGITKILLSFEKENLIKNKFIKSLKKVKSTIKILKLIILDRDLKDNEEIGDLLDSMLNQTILNKKSRSITDLYLLWHLISPINYTNATHSRLEIKKILEIFNFVKK